MSEPASAALGFGAMASSVGFGFRHGIDWDHLTALSDLAAGQGSSRRSMWLCTAYAAGHAVVVFILGLAVILFAAKLPAGLDSVMQRMVGATLVALGVQVALGLVRDRQRFRLRNRWHVVLDGASRLGRIAARYLWRQHRGTDRFAAPPPVVGPVGSASRPAAGGSHHRVHLQRGEGASGHSSALGAACIGMVHGVGAETPTQIAVFVAAAGAAGRAVGLLVLVAFVSGLFLANSLVAAAATAGLLNAERSWHLYAATVTLLAVGSLVVGSSLLVGARLPLPFSG